jgi:deoxyribonuclease-4
MRPTSDTVGGVYSQRASGCCLHGEDAMPLFGAHMSIAGGHHRALLAAQSYGCEAVQLFTKNANQWRARELVEDELAVFHKTRKETGIRLLLAHGSYLINLASPDEKLYRQSIEAFIIEFDRAERLGLTYLVAHPGAHVGSGEEAGLRRVARALDEIYERRPNHRVQILLETTAGQGSCLGCKFEHLAKILALQSGPVVPGVCFDTCHVFAAGYALAPEPEYRATMRAFDRMIGLNRLRAFHLNDSLKSLGSGLDRHAHIGKGCLGLEPFRLLVNDPRFPNRPMILETPKEEGENGDMDSVNLDVLRKLVQRRK